MFFAGKGTPQDLSLQINCFFRYDKIRQKTPFKALLAATIYLIPICLRKKKINIRILDGILSKQLDFPDSIIKIGGTTLLSKNFLEKMFSLI